MQNPFLDAISQRRSQYALGKDLPIDKDQVIGLIREAVRLAPSAFNSQSSRIVILLDDQHQAFWDITKEALRPLVPAENFAATDNKINSFAAGAGTVLFYEEQKVVTSLQEQFPLYADNFPVWSEHASAIAQFSVWTTLATANIGASLQHYNPLVDDAVAKRWDIPASWTLRAMMPFGSNQGGFGEKTFIEDSERLRIFK